MSIRLQWFFSFFMLLGWCLNTAMSAARNPRATLSAMLVYLGANLLLAELLYNIRLGSVSTLALYKIFGALSFTPLDILITAILDFNVPHEIVIVIAVFSFCMVGWIAGAVYRFLNPDPYSPRIIG